ncbi:MAG: two-component system response regulator [Desulfuromonas sp.]|uniref:sigma-54-dependent transcriptional regulator n=1 Tax=Desulfuromonas sp. TaxID=892 RepID=UPI000CB33F07|nr:sigma-54 dependent transcriptional regulator [Desulfuromonas sp.]PLX86602.1 MAG: two-component system response regulator [Desulfuromonas sp.]
MSRKLFPDLPILLVDDESSWLRSLSLSLGGSAGINHVLQCHDSRDVMGILAGQEVSLILLDLTMPHLSGRELLMMIAEEHPEVPVIILTGMNTVETAVECMKRGAFDFYVKTGEEERLLAGVRRALDVYALRRENSALRRVDQAGELENPEAFSAIITRSPKMEALFLYAEAVAPSGEPVLITGESGTGKELIARALHELGTPAGPWVAVNAAGLDDQVFSDTLFGHTRGAFTGADRARPGMIERAQGGTLFLDEVGDLSPASQVKLLRLLQEGEYLPLGSDLPKRSNARILCATNRDLAARQDAGAFRKDLYFRVRSHQVHLPPLRERTEDIPLLLDAFLDEAARGLGKKTPTPTAELAVLLATHHFPGNVRELRAMVYDAVSLHRTKVLSMESFRQKIGLTAGEGVLPPAALVFPQRLPTIVETTDLLVGEAMKRSKGNQSIAAGLLGISQQALSKRLKKTSR